MTGRWGRAAAAVAVVGAMLGGGATASSAQAETTLIVGLTQPWETLNPVSGFAVPEFEVWAIEFAGLTEMAAADFAVEPGLAESWVENEAGISYTYTLREGLKWSDGEPLTAEDVVWNITTSREQEWTNYVSAVANLTAEAVDDRTVTITSAVPDPKLPALGINIVPKHIWEEHATVETIDSYDALDGVGSGPFVISDYKSEESLTMVANDNYYGGRPAVDKIVFRYFSNPDAMIAALERGEIHAAHGIPASSVSQLTDNADIEVITGVQGGFDEIALNGGAAPAQPHPALLDLEFRKAINHAIDKAGAAEDLWFGLAEPVETISAAADLKWIPDLGDDVFGYDPAKAMEILDAAGYADTNGDGFREMPGGGDNIVLRHAVNTDGDLAASVGELYKGWLKEIGIDVQLDAYDQDQLYGVIADGDYDSFYWGWVPYLDPDPMLSYFTEAELGNWNDANWFDPKFEELYLAQKQEVDPAKRLELVHEMVTILHDSGVYITMWLSPDLQAYRTDAFEGWVRQPADVGPVMFSQSSPSYERLTPVGAGDSSGGSNTGLLVGLGAGAVAILAVGGFAMSRRGKSADDRE
ncbi:MAG: ABC transporter substrate-binding protein [Acidimicrobiales bacterium]